MIKEINDLTNDNIVTELDARTVVKKGAKAGGIAKTLGRGAWAVAKDVGLNIGDILANDGKNTAHHADDFRKGRRQGEEKAVKDVEDATGMDFKDLDPQFVKILKSGDYYSAAEAKQYMNHILSQSLDIKENVLAHLLKRKDVLKFEQDQIQKKRVEKKEAKFKANQTIESYMMEAYEAKPIDDEQIKKILERASVYYYTKDKKELFKKVVATFKDVNLPSNTVTKYWAKKGKPNTKMKLYNFMKGIKLSDNQILKTFRAGQVELNQDDLSKFGMEAKSLIDPKTINSDNLMRLSIALMKDLHLNKFVQALRASIKTDKTKQEKDDEVEQDSKN